MLLIIFCFFEFNEFEKFGLPKVFPCRYIVVDMTKATAGPYQSKQIVALENVIVSYPICVEL